MPSILTEHYHTDLALELKGRLAWSETIESLANTGGITANVAAQFAAAANLVNLYVFIGYPSPWPVEVDPPTPIDTPQTTDYDYWRNMLAVKRVSAANTNPVIPRVDWTANTVYTQYDDTVDVTGTEFYALVLDGGTTYQVYKCLWNANGALSTEQPTGTDVDPQTYADGYVWQYLYTLPTVSDRFLSAEWMPVYANASVQAAAAVTPGKLPVEVPLIITYGGARYNASVNVVATVIGDGTGATVSNAAIGLAGGTVTSITLLAGGAGYTNVASVNVYQSGNIAQATARVIIPPYPGHGYDPIHELHAKHLMCVVQFTDDEGGKLTNDNNFRQVGFIVNPQLANGTPANGTFYKQTTDVTLTAGSPTWSPDDLVINTTKTPSPQGIVVDVIDAGAGKELARLVQVNTKGLATPFAANDTLQVDGSLYPRSVSTEAVSGPELLPYSGQTLYINQRIPVTRANGQNQDIKVVLPFG